MTASTYDIATALETITDATDLTADEIRTIYAAVHVLDNIGRRRLRPIVGYVENANGDRYEIAGSETCGFVVHGPDGKLVGGPEPTIHRAMADTVPFILDAMG